LVTSATGTRRWPTGDSYSQWLRRILAAPSEPGRPTYTLFDSSTAEPVALLTETIAKAFAAPVTSRYQSAFAGGNPLVMAALAARYEIDERRILCTAGATSALSVVFRTYLAPGDHVLIETPGFDLFEDIAASIGAEIGFFERIGDRATIDLAALADAIRPNTRLIVLSDLHNPTGMPLDAATLAGIAALAAARGVDVIVDEVYREYAHAPATTAAHVAPNVIAINSLTKVYGLSGLRCGWILADPSRIEPIRIVHARLEFATSKITHTIAALVLEDTAPFEAHWRAMLDAARPIVEERFSGWRAAGLVRGALPDHGCVCFPELVGIADTRAFCEWLAEHYGVIVAPGEYFGKPGHVRLGFSTDPAPLAIALDLLGEGLASYRAATATTAMAG
jgi:aspartate/methionine/tyrosine aminotransferase